MVAGPLALLAVGEHGKVSAVSFGKGLGILPGHGAFPEGIGAVVTPDCGRGQFAALAIPEGHL